MGSPNKLRLGVIGCGHWGPNHVRVFNELDRSVVVACADVSAPRLDRVKQRYPHVRLATNHRDLLEDECVDAVVIATPTASHAALIDEALRHGKHVLVEKPMCMTAVEAARLDAASREARRVLMVGHVFLFNPGVLRLREAVASGQLGRVHYLDAVRTNLGPVRGDVNALYDLGAHDISVFNFLLDESPVAVSATGSRISQDRHEDVCFATLRYPSGALGHLHVSWLNPRKVRTLTAVGERRMAHWDDVDPSEALRLYDKGLEEPPYYDSFGEFRCLLRSGDMHAPTVPRVEPLVNQANAFLDTVLDGAPNRCGPREAGAVVAVLEAADRSLRSNGQFVPVSLGGAPPVNTVERRRVTGAPEAVEPFVVGAT